MQENAKSEIKYFLFFSVILHILPVVLEFLALCGVIPFFLIQLIHLRPELNKLFQSALVNLNKFVWASLHFVKAGKECFGLEAPVANILSVTALWSKYRGAGSCTATMCRRMLSFLKHFLHDPGQGSVSMFCSPVAKWRHWEWEVQHSVSSEALQKNSVVFSIGVPQQTVVQSSLPQLGN